MSWYQCSFPKEWIMYVHLCETLPQKNWTEQWFSEELQCSCGCYGEELWIAGETVPVVGGMFEKFVCLREISGEERLNPKGCKDLSRVFAGCISLEKLNVSHWNTAEATTMEHMFDTCVKLEALDVSKWKLGKCSSICAMFRECQNIRQLDVSKWAVGKVRNFSYAFVGCKKLEKLDVSKWNTASARHMESTFYHCGELTVLDVSRWKTEHVRNFRGMFHGCQKLKKLSLSKWKMRPDAAVEKMFLEMYGRISLPRQLRFMTMIHENYWMRGKLPDKIIGYIATIEFHKDCGKPHWVDRCWVGDVAGSGYILCVRQGDRVMIFTRGGKVYANENSRMMFSFLDEEDLSWVRYIDNLDLLDTRHTKYFDKMFAFNVTLQHLKISHFDMSQAISAESMFEECRRLHKMDDSKWNIPWNCRTNDMYRGCYSFEKGGLRIIK